MHIGCNNNLLEQEKICMCILSDSIKGAWASEGYAIQR